jgi:hypothetical protein
MLSDVRITNHDGIFGDKHGIPDAGGVVVQCFDDPHAYIYWLNMPQSNN